MAENDDLMRDILDASLNAEPVPRMSLGLGADRPPPLAFLYQDLVGRTVEYRRELGRKQNGEVVEYWKAGRVLACYAGTHTLDDQSKTFVGVVIAAADGELAERPVADCRLAGANIPPLAGYEITSTKLPGRSATDGATKAPDTPRGGFF